MPEKEVLNFKLVPRLEQVGDANRNQMEEREHQI
jgi:hypothetical protein